MVGAGAQLLCSRLCGQLLLGLPLWQGTGWRGLLLEQGCRGVPAASDLLLFSLYPRKIVAEYEKTIAQMIGEVPPPGRVLGAGSCSRSRPCSVPASPLLVLLHRG